MLEFASLPVRFPAAVSPRVPPTMPDPLSLASAKMKPLPHLIFMSRWLQLPLYLGLIVAQGVYVWHFWVELTHLVEAAFGNQAAIQQIVTAVTPPGQAVAQMKTPNETVIMLVVLGLIDVVMISNLLIMVIVGGYETFVSRMRLGVPSRPARMAVARQRKCAQGQARHRDHRHIVDPPAEDLHQRRGLRREDAAVADRDPHHLPAVGDGHRRDRPADAQGRSHAAKVAAGEGKPQH